jgi:hypothetical protein
MLQLVAFTDKLKFIGHLCDMLQLVAFTDKLKVYRTLLKI